MPSKTTQPNRTARYFQRLRAEGRRPLTVYITARARKRLDKAMATGQYANLHDAVSDALTTMEI